MDSLIIEILMYEKNFMVIFDQWSKLEFSFNAPSDIQILTWLYHVVHY